MTQAERLDVLCLGEAMGEIAFAPGGEPQVAVGGDTFNTAVYLAREGLRVGFASAVGEDPFGDLIQRALQDNDVSDALLHRIPSAETGLYAMEAQLRVALDEARAVLDPDNAPATPKAPVATPLPAPVPKPVDPVDAADLSSKAAGSEHHHQNSQKDSFESERATADVQPSPSTPSTGDSAAEKCSVKGKACVSVKPERALVSLPSEGSDKLPNVPLSLVLSACPEVQSYAQGPIRHWHDLVRAAHLLRPMMGISPSAWDEAMRAMGPEEASVVLAAMLERFGAISSPGDYLRHVSAKAQAGGFSCGPMVMALLRRERA